MAVIAGIVGNGVDAVKRSGAEAWRRGLGGKRSAGISAMAKAGSGRGAGTSPNEGVGRRIGDVRQLE